jgi:pimeloyl-ACP methyl ester carboxylesterase
MVRRIWIISFSIITIIYLFSNSNSSFTYSAWSTFAQLQAKNGGEIAGQKVSFLTDDGVLIVGTYYAPASPHQKTATHAVILLHMLGRNRNDWNTFASSLSNNSNSDAVLSIDLRGHGESINQNGSTISYQSFSPADYNKMVLDVKAAKHFLVTQKNIGPNNIVIVGASIGANVALKYAASDPSIRTVVLLSPGLNYMGVTTSDSIRKYDNPVYIAAGGKDLIAGSDPQILCGMINCGNHLKVYQNSNSHGTDMLPDPLLNPPLSKLIISWLSVAFGKSN